MAMAVIVPFPIPFAIALNDGATRPPYDEKKLQAILVNAKQAVWLSFAVYPSTPPPGPGHTGPVPLGLAWTSVLYWTATGSQQKR